MRARGRPRGFDRAAALRQAMRVFWERGYEGASLADLTGAMGINRPSLYAAFGCKEALFLEAVALYEAEGTAGRLLDEAPTARAAVEAMLRRNAEELVRPGQPPGCMIVLAASVGTAENAELRAALARRRAQSLNVVQSRLERGIAEGDVPDGTDTAALARFYATVLHGLSIQARDGAAPPALQAVVDCAMAAWEPLTAGGGAPG
jgi:AcrR family transcriptional regulator